MTTSTAYGSEYSNATTQECEFQTGGTYCKDAITGECYFIPEPEIDTYSDEMFGYSPGYDPFADEDNNDSFVQPYYLDSGRTIVNNPQYNVMCRNTVYIETKYTDGVMEYVAGSTGFFIGPNAVATAGHVVYKGSKYENDGWISEAIVYPALNTGSTKRPYGSAKGIQFRCGGNWAKNGDHSDDWGIIILDSNIGEKVGWLGLQWQSDPYSNTEVWENGYPLEVGNKSNRLFINNEEYRDQYIRSGTVNATSVTNILNSTDMFASQGDSGGPCYINSEKFGYTAIGIASFVTPLDKTGKNISQVNFRTIDRSLYEKLIEFRTSTLNGG